jgi:hypothetical protein
MANFNFGTGGYSISGNDLSFPASAQNEGSPNNFNFTEAGYTPSYDFNFGLEQTQYVIYNILAGAKNNFTAIWADPTASLTNGKMYASSAGAFSVVKLDDDTLYDYYTTTHKGRGNETLDDNTTVDINVG